MPRLRPFTGCTSPPVRCGTKSCVKCRKLPRPNSTRPARRRKLTDGWSQHFVILRMNFQCIFDGGLFQRSSTAIAPGKRDDWDQMEWPVRGTKSSPVARAERRLLVNKPTLAGTLGNGSDAPIPAVRGIESVGQGTTFKKRALSGYAVGKSGVPGADARFGCQISDRDD